MDNILVINASGGSTKALGLRHGAFDAAEVPFVRYVFWKSRGEPLSAIPVFPDRFFQFQYIYTRPDTGITSLADLRGRRVMAAPGYFSTPQFWYRGILKEECGILPHEIEWYTLNLGTDEGMRIPDNVRITKTQASSILGLEPLLDGTVDCLMTARTALVPPNHQGRVTRVFGDAYARQREWYRRKGYFPILHVVAVRNNSLARRPSLGEELCHAFDLAKERTYRSLQDERMTLLPFMRGFLDDTLELCGDDPWPYGLERNRAELDQFLEYAHDQGLTPRRLSVEDLSFDERATGYQFKARMVPGCILGGAEGGWSDKSIVPD